jgi:transcription elongation factor Elf1
MAQSRCYKQLSSGAKLSSDSSFASLNAADSCSASRDCQVAAVTQQSKVYNKVVCIVVQRRIGNLIQACALLECTVLLHLQPMHCKLELVLNHAC